jgi:hypothetical protein
MRREFDILLDSVLNHDFLDDNTKNMLKLAIANRFIKNPMATKIQ